MGPGFASDETARAQNQAQCPHPKANRKMWQQEEVCTACGMRFARARRWKDTKTGIWVIAGPGGGDTL